MLEGAADGSLDKVGSELGWDDTDGEVDGLSEGNSDGVRLGSVEGVREGGEDGGIEGAMIADGEDDCEGVEVVINEGLAEGATVNLITSYLRL